MADASVRVAVRVRPFNQREKDRKAKLIIEMKGPTTSIKDPEDGKKKDFAFDFSYWSHDGFHDEDGYSAPDSGSNYADQKKVMSDLGNDVLENAWKGFNCSLFAYGQTGSGKSYSMVGYGVNKGIIPQATDELYRRIEAETDSDKQYRVTVSMLEIYNEQIQDLLNPKNNKAGGLKVREKPGVGVYVDGLGSMAVKSYKDIERLMEQGTNNRTVASTNMNATSSRAHTVFTVNFTIITMSSKTEVTSKINLIDLAGSERAESTGATGDRLKEGAMINKSLSALGNVISALAENSGGKKKFVPYRDSVLTRLLQESLGGNAKTIMIAALSPADINFDETLSTLRYADRAKKIKNKAVINESPADKLIRELKEENERLKKLLEGKSPEEIAAIMAGEAGGGGNAAENEEFRKMQEELEANQRMMEEMQKSWEQKLAEAQAAADSNDSQLASKGFVSASQVDSKQPRLVNLNEDPAMNEALIYMLKDGETKVGRADAEDPQDIQLTGLSINKAHCVIKYDGAKSVVSPVGDSKVFVNGKAITGDTEMEQSARIVLGVHHIFRFHNPALHKSQGDGDGPAAIIDWEMAQKELMEGMGLNQSGSLAAKEKELEEEAKKKEEEFNKKLKEMEEAKAKEQEEMNKKLAEQQAEFEAKMKDLKSQAEMKQAQEEFEKQKMDMEQRNKSLEEEIERQKKEKEDFEKNKERRKQEYLHLEENLMKVIPMTREANEIAKELEKHVTFEVKLRTVVPKSSTLNPLEELRQLRKIDIDVLVADPTTNAENFWSYDKFTNRIYMMREMVMEKQQYGKTERAMEQDPFWDPPEHKLIGTAHAYLQSLAYILDIDETLKIVDYKGAECGFIKVKIAPCLPDGNTDVDAVENHYPIIEEGEQNVFDALDGKRLDILVEVTSCESLPPKYTNDVFVKFDLWEEELETPIVSGKNPKPTFNFKKQITFEKCDQKLLRHLLNDAATFEVLGMADEHIEVSKAARERAQKLATDKETIFRQKMAKEAGLPDLTDEEAQKTAVGCNIM